MKILLLSDTHAYCEEDILKYINNVDEVWHAGDWLSKELILKIESLNKPLRGVWGNVDGHEIKAILPKDNRFSIQGIKFWITHIGGHPGKYNPKIIPLLKSHPPDVFICGHSHILKIMRDKNLNNMLYVNPGAAGKHGFHIIRTMVSFEIKEGKIHNMAVIELGERAAIE